MSTRFLRSCGSGRGRDLFIALIFLFSLASRVAAADFTVASPGSYYTFNSQPAQNPTLTLVRGRTYTFAVSTASIHPFRINSTGVINNNINQGTITYTVPTNNANYTYVCSVHGFGGSIVTVAPPPPPTISIVSFAATTNLTIRSTGATNWSVLPEFSTNLATTNWYALTVQTNRYLNGTNETLCGKPSGSSVFIRIRSQPK